MGDENVKKSFKKEMQKAEDDTKTLKDMMPQTSTHRDNSQTRSFYKSFTNFIQKEEDSNKDVSMGKYLMKNHTNPNPTYREKQQKKQFIKNLMNFIQEEVKLDSKVEGAQQDKAEIMKIKNMISKTNTKPDPELLKIKSLINHKSNATNPEIQEIKSLIHPKNGEDQEILEIKSLIHPHKKIVKSHKKVNKTKADKKSNKIDAVEKFNKTQIKEVV